MSEFRPYGLFYDVLSGEFAPPSDPLQRRHTLARLAVATTEKGRGPDFCRDYVPSWANSTYAIVQTAQDPDLFRRADHRLTIAGSVAYRPLVRTLTDYKPSPTNTSRGKHELVIVGGDLEIVRPLALGPALDNTRQEVAEVAQDFYSHYPANR